MSEKNESSFPPEFTVLAVAIKDLKFGSVTLQVENGRIIQLDKLEKIRFDKLKK